MMSSNTRLKSGEAPYALRYHVQNKEKHFEEYAHHMHRVKNVHIRSYSGPYFSHPDLIILIFRISRYSVQMRENTDQNNSEY